MEINFRWITLKCKTLNTVGGKEKYKRNLSNHHHWQMFSRKDSGYIESTANNQKIDFSKL